MDALASRQSVELNVDHLIEQSVCVVSGHHGKALFSPLRVVMDESGGPPCPFLPLSAVMLPECIVLRHTGSTYAGSRRKVFPEDDPRCG